MEQITYKGAKCDDCGQFARYEDLEEREPWLGGCRHRYGTGCWPKEEKKESKKVKTKKEQS